MLFWLREYQSNTEVLQRYKSTNVISLITIFIPSSSLEIWDPKVLKLIEMLEKV